MSGQSSLPGSDPQPDDESLRLIAEVTAGNAGLLGPGMTRTLFEIRALDETEETK